MAVKLTDLDKGYKQAMRRIREAARVPAEVTVGIQGEKATEPKKAFALVGGKRKQIALGSAPTNVEVAAVHEFGSRDGTIPERSFIRATVIEHQKKYIEKMRAATDSALFEARQMRGMLLLFGEDVRKDMVLRIRSGIPPALAEETVKRKGGIETPLFLTGQLINSITAKVRKP